MLNTTIQRVTTPTGDPAWLVTDYDDVKALLADPRLGRSHADPEHAPRVSRSAIFGGPMGHPSTEAVDHARTRRLLAPAFSARRMARLRPRVAAIITGLLDAMACQAHPVDLHESVSFPLPALVICELLGVPYADREDFRRWSDDAAHLTDAARSQAGLMKLWDYMHALVKQKKAEPGDDVISDLAAAAAADPELADDGIAGLCAGLLFAGHETTVTAIDRGVLLLLTHPEQADELRHDPALIDPAVEEILRSWMPMRTSGTAEQVAGLPRYANSDFTFGGVTIRTGELVMLGLHWANLDEQRFPEPDQFDVHRASNPHMTFGHGPRFCVGAPLARIELQTLFPALLSRFPTLRLAVPIEALRGRDELLTGGLIELPVTW
ncbi:MAG TPA: cytochrome P450 [Pseudonocardiaceae bacterium]|jgi:pentalenolactone synthase|nr:cytochrome P450 [Pseudonocardiaceae bacterium]